MPSKRKNSQSKNDSLPKKPKSTGTPSAGRANSKSNANKKNSSAASNKRKKATPKFEKGSVAEALFGKLKGKMSDREIDEYIEYIS